MHNHHDLEIVRRDYHGDFQGHDLQNWHAQGPVCSQFINTLSVLFPRGERFFIDAVRAHSEHPNVQSNPVLKAQIKGFIGQEAMHGREHRQYNEALLKSGLPVDSIEKALTRRLNWADRKLSIQARLAITIALEHYTALMAERILKDPRIVSANPESLKMEDLWLWHAMEETEHKAVAYDVWKAVYGTNLNEYLVRTGLMSLTSGLFIGLLSFYHFRMIIQSKDAKKEFIRGHIKLLNIFFGKLGFVRKSIRPFLDYYRMDFHPWLHDNLSDTELHKARLAQSLSA